jgi:leader peptidase (prepilin peptidase)/N-methyltransferase
MDSGPDAVTELLALWVSSPIGVAFAALWGALWGSFFNVTIYRVGTYQSVMYPPSRCPGCGRAVRPIENVPILSWIFLRGRCAGCDMRISVRYPLVEALSCALAAAWWWHVAIPSVDPVHVLARFFVGFAFVGTLLVLSGIDLDHLLLPDRITYPAIPIFFVGALLLGDVPRLELLIGPFAGYGIVAVTAEIGYFILRREAMGYGDAKLLALVGAFLGWRAVVFAFFAAPFVGLAVILPRAMLRGRSLRGIEIAYGPFLAVATLLYLFVDDLLRALLPL